MLRTAAKSHSGGFVAQSASALSVRASTDDPSVLTVLGQLAGLGYTGLTRDDLGRLNKPDEYETEMQLMADVHGYFKVAYKVRLPDYQRV